MPIDPQMHQQLLELIYELLPAEEAAALGGQIAQDEELAGAYAEARRRAGLIGEALRRKADPIRLPRPALPAPVPSVLPAAAEPAAPRTAPIRAKASARASQARWAGWVVGLAAGILLAISVGGYLFHRGQLADIAADHLRLRLMGPARLQAGAANRYAIRTTSVTGSPLGAQIDFALYAPDGTLLMAHQEKADGDGSLVVTVPGDLPLPAGLPPPRQVRMEVVGSHARRQERLESWLAIEPLRYLTRLALDKPAYRPGETIRWRSLTRSRFGLAADRELPIAFSILDPPGGVLARSTSERLTQRGVGWGEFELPGALGEGEYTLVARSLDGSFPDRQERFALRRDEPPTLRSDLEFSRSAYAPGDNVVAHFACYRNGDAPAAGARLAVRGTVAGKEVFYDPASTSPNGLRRIEFALPRHVASSDARLSVDVEDGAARQRLTKAIPLGRGKARVEFFPEGGTLVAGLENRVYFTSRSAEGKPLSIAGKVLGARDQQVALLETVQEGAGSFSFKPAAGEPYRLKIDVPAGVADQPRLPEAPAGPGVVLAAGLGVIGPGKPLEFNVRATEKDLPLGAAAFCGEVLVGQQAFVTEGASGAVSIPLDPEVSGVIRLRIYDYRSSPPKTVAERLVYRQPAHRLEVRVGQPERSDAAGAEAELVVSVTDENGSQAAAGLGVAVLDEDLFEAPERWAALPAQFLPAGDFDGDAPGELQRAAWALAGDPKAAVALDLALGTQGRRWLDAKSLDEPAREGRLAPQPAGVAVAAGQPIPPAMFDNLPELQARYTDSLASYRANRTRVLSALTTSSLCAGVGLVLFVAMLTLMSIRSGLRLWVPSLGTAAVCIVIGAVLMNPERLKLRSSAEVAFASFELPPAEAAPAPEAAAKPEKSLGDASEPLKSAAQDKSQVAQTPLPAAPEAAPAAAAPSPARPMRVQQTEEDKAEGLGRGGPSRDAPVAMKPAAPAPGAIVTPKGDHVYTPDLPKQSIASPERAVQRGGEGQGQRQAGLQGFAGRGSTAAQGSLAKLTDQAGGKPREEARSHGESAETLFWQPLLLTDDAGRASLRLDTSGRTASYRVLVGAHDGGRLGFGTTQLRVRPPVAAGRKAPQGFPWEFSASGQIAGRRQVTVHLPDDALPGSLAAEATALPTLLAELAKAADGLAEQPGGFEQAAATSVLGLLMVRCLQEPDVVSPAMARRARQCVDAGYAALAGCESPEKGFEWFGGSPASEVLSARGLALLGRMEKVRDVDPALLARTNQWFRDRPKGQSEVAGAATGGAETAALVSSSAAGEPEIRLSDLDVLVLKGGRTDAAGKLVTDAARKLVDQQQLAESTFGKRPLADSGDSAARGKDVSRQVETVALAALAWLKSPGSRAQADRAVAWLHENRQASGAFGSARATALALEAIAEHRSLAGRAPSAASGGRLIVTQGEKVLAEREVRPGSQEPVALSGLEAGLRPGENRLELQWTGKDKIPYLLAVRWRSPKPANDPSCPLRLTTRFAPPAVKENQPAVLEAELSNSDKVAVPLPVAVLGLPAGLEARPENLERLKKAGAVDSYQLRPGEVVLYWRALAAGQKVRCQVETSAAGAGKYWGAASWASSLPAPQARQWAEPVVVEVSR